MKSFGEEKKFHTNMHYFSDQFIVTLKQKKYVKIIYVR